MEVRFAKNVGLVTIGVDDVVNYKPNDLMSYLDFRNVLCMDGVMEGLYKIHFIVDEKDILKDSSLEKLIDMIKELSEYIKTSKVYIHSICDHTKIPNADTLWAQEFATADNGFVSIRKFKNDLRIEKYKREVY